MVATTVVALTTAASTEATKCEFLWSITGWPYDPGQPIRTIGALMTLVPSILRS